MLTGHIKDKIGSYAMNWIPIRISDFMLTFLLGLSSVWVADGTFKLNTTFAGLKYKPKLNVAENYDYDDYIW